MPSLDLAYYRNSDVLGLSQDLLGKFLFTQIDGKRTGGMIVETEAYSGPEDKASHAYNNRRTKRTEVMFHQGGKAYVYLCYGIHSLLNVVTNQADIPHAILIRAIEPTLGTETMLHRRNKTALERTLTAGPGALTKALGVTTQHNGFLLTSDTVWIEDQGISFSPVEIIASPRVGIDYAQEWVQRPWRFRVKDSKWTSRPT